VENVLVVVPSAKEADFDMWTADAESFFTIHCVPNGSARILFRPDAGQAGGILQTDIQSAKRQDSSHALVHRSVDLRVTTVEVVVTVRTACVVRVGSGPDSKLVWVVASHILDGDPVLQCLATVAALNPIDAANVRRQTEETR